DGQRGGYQGSRDGQGGRDGQRSGGYQGNRDGRGFQGSRDGQNRDGQRGGYQGSRDGQGGRDGQRSGGYQGNRDGQGRDGQRSGYQGNRDGRGFQGNRDGQNRDGQRGGYQGNRDGQGGRDGQRSGGYQGNRDGRGFQGSRDGQGRDQRGGFSGGRDGQRGGRGQSSSKSAFDTPIQTKPTSNRQNKNAYKNDKYDKRRHDEEEGRLKGGKPAKGAFIMPQKPAKPKEEEVKVITLPDTITIKELADKMKVQPSVIVGKLFKEKGQMVTVNQEVDYDQAEEIAMEFDILCEKEEKIDVIAELLKEDEENEANMVTRPPVVCVMGHVDHGKTSLLDAIRKTNVTAKEAGGITQHIGAYVVEINGQKITFLDTPGHEAFTAMRMRGAQATDIAILVVAADDGVMPQTVEAINHAKAAGVEIIVAVNKIDKPSANVDRVKQEMSEYELVPEDWGGSTIFVPVSAHTHEGIKDLLEMILLTAEVKELKANPNRKARGIVIEAELDKGKGPVATVLVQKGTLKVGQNVAVGACFGKVRAMMDDKGRRVKEAGPSTPVEILGLNDVPNAGEIFVEMDNEKEARAFAETFISEEKNRLIDDTKTKLSLDALFSQIKAGSVKELPIIVKADVQGSVEAVKQSLMKLSNEEVMVKVIHGGVGAVNESDVNLASASNAIIIGFNVRPDATAKSVAEREKVDIRLYKVIYQAIEDVEAAMKGMLDPVFEEKIIGHAVVRQTFKASGVGTIAGAYVLDGQFTRGCSARITRDGQQIFDGALASLKRFKDDVKEVKAGYECGLVFDKFNDIKEDDMIEAYAMVEVPR
ncbi:MAG TPA: translation initiation factor IF-2, partial [Candidatus Caccovicinus merdipullorum]|nr:translation initiation factor IF-2 [Candidatus Caccovicinus merdipullorum]